jgi:hypothetical protein
MNVKSDCSRHGLGTGNRRNDLAKWSSPFTEGELETAKD